ncbi:MAG: exo-beta-N-acetylmuramidase NamZ domain-containing protein [Chitinophagaceae bacterium]
MTSLNNFLLFITASLLISNSCVAQKKVSMNDDQNINNTKEILPAAQRPELYLPLLKGKNVAVFANQTSMVGDKHLVDMLQQSGITIKVIFGPEHGFRGTADAGEKVETVMDKATGVPVVSLYSKKRKPSKEDLQGVDIMLFDIQDVGVRFYTYISSLQEYMETAIEFNLPLIVFDRPNPNGHYVDGPVLEPKFKSFVGMQPVPIVYGMTIGEYAKMLLEEGLLSKEAMEAYTKNVLAAIYPPGAKYFGLTVIPCGNYTHKSKYVLPVRPSPNLPDMGSIYWYPSTCFFEGTVLSEGRGTDKPFQIFGHPSLPKSLFSFTPTSREGAKEPKLKDQLCYGWNVSGTTEEILRNVDNKIQLSWLINAYNLFPDKKNFFLAAKKEKLEETDYFFNKLAGNATLMQQIKNGLAEKEIRKTWEPKLNEFKKTRKKYLLYPDFE